MANNIEAELKEREEKRKKSGLIAKMIDAPIIEADTNQEKKQSIAKPEIKSYKTQIALRPSLYKAAKEKCKTMGISFNEVVNQLITNWLEKE